MNNDNTTNNNSWTFTLVNVPKSISSTGQYIINNTTISNNDTSTNTSNDPLADVVLVPVPVVHNDNDDNTDNNNLDDEDTATTATTATTLMERKSLLLNINDTDIDIDSTTNTESVSSVSSVPSWILHTNMWSIQSTILLKITYCIGWETIPEYTTTFQSSSKVSQVLGTAFTWCCTSDTIAKQPNYYTDTYTTADILKIQYISNYTITTNSSKTGSKTEPNTNTNSTSTTTIISCPAIKIYLRPLQVRNGTSTTTTNKIPPLLHNSFQKHLRNIHTNQNSLVNNDSNSKNVSTTTTATTNKNDVHSPAVDNNNNETNLTGPVLIFAFMKNNTNTSTDQSTSSSASATQPPPLVWKVIIPSPTRTMDDISSIISIHTISILDGSFVQSTSKSPTSAAASAETATTTSSPDSSNQNQQQRKKRRVHTTTTESVKKEEENNNNDTTCIDNKDIIDSNDIIGLEMIQNNNANNNNANTNTKTYISPTQKVDNEENNSSSPSHIYINGWQSWSYAGSVMKGMKQPTSAMHDVFSRAFLSGASLPPSSSSAVSSLQQQTSSFDAFYQSDFFTCLTCHNKTNTSNSNDIELLNDTSMASDQRRQQNDNRKRNGQQQQQQLVLDEHSGPAITMGWLSQREQYGIVTVNRTLDKFQMHSSAHKQIFMPNTTIQTDWAYLLVLSSTVYDEEPMADYIHTVAEINNAQPLQNGNLLTGWCSWYVFYENISANIIRENISSLLSMQKQHLSTNVTIIDDGYMTAWGDWDSLKPKAFPTGSGLDSVSNDITSMDTNGIMRSGLWLAPFAADKHSTIVKNHPEWVIRNDKGIPANSGNIGRYFYGLDATNPAVRAHAYEAIRRAVQDWKFTVLKIDFLYACCLEGNGKYDLSMTRAQTMDIALRTIRTAAGPNVFIIGCGCPIGSGIGYVDAMRISADTGPSWKPSLPLPWWDNANLPSLKGMIRNSITRSPLGHRWWHNDPDCIMLGKHTHLTNVEITSAATIVAMTCGMLLLSDDLPKVNKTRLSIISKIFPLTGVTAVPLDLHSTTIDSDGMPTLLRLWCTDTNDLHDNFHSNTTDTDTRTDSSTLNYKNMYNNVINNDNNNDFHIQSDDNDDDHRRRRVLFQKFKCAATFFARQASFRPGSSGLLDTTTGTSTTTNTNTNTTTTLFERKRSCISVTAGLGTWTCISISNWSSKESYVSIPYLALEPPPTFRKDYGGTIIDNNNTDDDSIQQEIDELVGYHVFAFWSSKYERRHSLTSQPPIGRHLKSHETEVYHIKKVSTNNVPQYIGSTIHFSCGYEVQKFHVLTTPTTSSSLSSSNSITNTHTLVIQLKTDYQREGYVFVSIPTSASNEGTPYDNIRNVIVNNEIGQYSVIHRWVAGTTSSPDKNLSGRVLKIFVSIHADTTISHDGEIRINYEL